MPNDLYTKHPYLHWIQKTPMKKQALLVEPPVKGVDTPEGLYQNEGRKLSTLEERAIAHGIRFEKKY
jgi:hypothetical protein